MEPYILIGAVLIVLYVLFMFLNFVFGIIEEYHRAWREALQSRGDGEL